MKKFKSLVVLVYLFVGNINAQSLAEWDTYFQNNKPNDYVSYSNYKGRNILEGVSFNRYNKIYYLIERKEKKLQKVKQMSIPEVNNILKENLKLLKYLKKKLNRQYSKETNQYVNDFNNPETAFSLMAIKYHSLHYNHYRLKTEDEIKQIKNEKMQHAYKVLNQLSLSLHQNIN